MNINVAVIGYGHLGKWHAEKAEALANLKFIIDKDPSKREMAKKNHPKVEVLERYEDVVDRFDAAVVVTPTSFHAPIVKDLLKSKKHIFCEKPLCSTLEDAQEIIELKKSYSDLVLQVGHSERFHESWEIIEKYRHFLDGNCVIRMNRFGPFKGRATDVDVVQDLMIHDLDLLYYLFKEIPATVRSTGYKIRTNNWDFATAEFTFKSGKRAFIVCSRNHVKEVRDLEVTSDKGTIYVDLVKNQIQMASTQDDPTEELVQSIDYKRRDHLFVEQEHFYQSIEERKGAIVTFEEGLLSVKLITKVLESLETQDVVTIEP